MEFILEERIQELVDLEVALQRPADKIGSILSSEEFRREVLLENWIQDLCQKGLKRQEPPIESEFWTGNRWGNPELL